MSEPLLSVLIPSLPERISNWLTLFNMLTGQAEYVGRYRDLEVLLLLDNKRRSTGLKRQALLSIARGKYVAFVDDDDEIMPAYVPQILEQVPKGADVIVFDSLCQINDGPRVHVQHDLEFPNEEYNPAGFRRSPWHIHAWRRELAQSAEFPDKQYHEDVDWLMQVLPRAKTQARIRIDVPLYVYQFNSKTTEASK